MFGQVPEPSSKATLGDLVDTIEFPVHPQLAIEAEEERHAERNIVDIEQPHSREIAEGEVENVERGGSGAAADAAGQVRDRLPHPQQLLPQEDQEPNKSTFRLYEAQA